MAQFVYSGLQGHGKSYEVVRSVIVNAVVAGRRVVTNIAGLQVDKIKSYALKTHKDKTSEVLGDIVSVTNEDVTKPNFFPVEKADNSDKIVQGGDIVILDECWRWYVTGEKLPDGHLTFFRMHRHFLHPVTGQSCDIVLIVQDIDDLQRKIRATVEKSFLMQKNKELGLDNCYVVNVYSGKAQTVRALLDTFNHIYNPEVFELYSSYSQSTLKTGVEKSADKRGNIFNRPMIKYGLPLSLLAIGYGFYGVWGFFHPKDLKPTSSASASAASTAGAASVPVAVAVPSGPAVSTVWRLVGHFQYGSLITFILVDGSGRIRHVSNPPAMKVTAGEFEIALPSGEIITQWSGAVPGQSKQPGVL